MPLRRGATECREAMRGQSYYESRILGTAEKLRASRDDRDVELKLFGAPEIVSSDLGAPIVHFFLRSANTFSLAM